MNPILAISNDISAVPAPTFVGQLASGQTGPGGFASTFASRFAAARGLASATESVAGGSEASDGTLDGTTAGAEEASTVHASVPGAGNSLRKLVNSSALLTASPTAAVNLVVPGFGFISAAAPRIPASQPQMGLSQVNPPQMSFPQTSVVPAFTAIAQAQTRDDVTGTVQTSAQTTAYDAAVQSVPVEYSAPAVVAGIFDSVAGNGGATSNLASGSTPRTVPGMEIANPNAEASRPEIPAAVRTATEPIASSLPNELARENPAAWSEGSSQLPAPAVAPGQRASITGLPMTGSPAVSSLGVIKDDQDNLSLASAYGASGRGLGSAQAAVQADQTVVPTMPAPAGTNVKTEGQPGAVVLLASAEFLTIQVNSENVGAPDAGVQSDVATQTAAGDPRLAAINSDAQNLASTVLNPLPQLMPAGAVMGWAGARAETVPAASVRGQGVDGRSSILDSLTAAAGPASREVGPMANQTPFSIFFSDPASGTESAASTLPRMILPGTGAASRGSHSGGAEAPGSGAQTNFSSGALQSGASQSGASQNAVPSNTTLSNGAASNTALSNGTPSNSLRPNGKESLTGSESGNPVAGVISRRDADLQAAGAQLAVSQTGTSPAPAPAASGGVTLPLAAPVTDPLPKAGTLPETTPTGPTSTVPATAEIPAVAAPGQVQLAQMISRAEQSEMRIGMSTSAFGSVEVRAVVHASDVGLVIGSEKGDLRSLMANDIPAITSTLQQQSLRLNSVNFMQGFAFSNNASGGGDSQQRAFAPAHAFASSASSEAAVDDSAEALAAGEFSGGRGLSILA